MADDLPFDFTGTGRFEVRSCLGSGGMGMVYEAYDREQKTRVALKTLKERNPGALLRLKNEFRALQDISHPNLVALGELFEERGRWFFTMEYVNGVDFITHVRGDSATPDRLYDEPRLREALAQLVQGLMALHEMDCIHRDIKPSNVLVTFEGRVVLVDFGLVAQRDPDRQSDEHFFPVGTAAYMAPEQAAGHTLGPAADWYSVGVLLYEALTSELPFSGSAIQVMLAKQEDKPPRPRDSLPQVPEELDRLCWDLMQFNPSDRPDGDTILRRLNVASERRLPATSSSTTRRPLFVGRQQELVAIIEACAKTRQGQPSCVLLLGGSGLGKSELLRAVTREIRTMNPTAVLLSGRCYQRESVPFKAFDGVVDALSRTLRGMSKDEIVAVAPRDVGPLTRVFPVLGRVHALLGAPQALRRVEDLQELQSLAFGALREMLARLTDRFQVVVTIDDLQWAGADSLKLLRALLQTPHAPAISLLAALRTPSGAGSTAPSTAQDAQDAQDADVSALALERSTTLERSALTLEQALAALPHGCEQLEVQPLPERDAIELAVRLLGSTSDDPAVSAKRQSRAERIAREAAGHPLFIHELVQHAEMLGEQSVVIEPRLEDALFGRVTALDIPRRSLVELVAVAGGPIRLETAIEAAGIQVADFTRLVAQLRIAHLLRTSGTRMDDTVEPYHDRVRAAVLERLPSREQRRWHAKIARAMEVAERKQPELLALHFERAGSMKQAAQYAEQAAAEAAEALAFDRAARLYGRAVALWSTSRSSEADAERRRLWIGLGDALANAGRGSRAAGAYLEALPGAKKAESLELARRAADQLFRSGHLDKGLTVTKQVLSSLGMKLPRTPLGALASLLSRRLQLRLRGITFRERDESQVSAEMLVRVDICHSVAIGLAIADNIRGADFSTRFVRLALDAGEPRRVLMALASEASYVAASAPPRSRYLRRLTATSEALLERLQDPIARGYLVASKAFYAVESGAWSTALEQAELGEAIMMAHGGTSWERATMRFIILWSLFYLGELAALTERVMPAVQEALDRGDRFAQSGMVLGRPNLVYLNLMGPSRAREEVAKIMGRWKVQGYHLQHYYAHLAEAHIDLYQGEGRRALDRVGSNWPHLKRSLLLRLPLVRYEALHLRARAALAATRTASPSERKTLLSQALGDARRLARHGRPWTTALSRLVQAGVAAQRGQADGAVSLLENAVETLDAAEMKLYAAAARRRLGILIGADRGAEHAAAGKTVMQQQHVTDPARMTALLVPGFAD